jgi:8-oxo-dGTP diphosphatase
MTCERVTAHTGESGDIVATDCALLAAKPAPRWVAGFLIEGGEGDYTGVVLVRKNRPVWQSGYLNGVGGHIEPGETPEHAMRREFQEEAGLDVPDWHHFATVECPAGAIAFFRAFCDAAEVQTMTDEPIEVRSVDEVLASGECLPNLSWLLPLAVYTHDTYAPVVAAELYPCGHATTERGCGGCDAGAVEFVIEDNGTMRSPYPHETSIGQRSKCPRDCLCLCHDTGGGVHDHPDQPCPGKAVSEVFEVVERRTGQRAMEHVHLTATAGLDWLARQPEKYHTLYRVQSVAVYQPSPLTTEPHTV